TWPSNLGLWTLPAPLQRLRVAAKRRCYIDAAILSGQYGIQRTLTASSQRRCLAATRSLRSGARGTARSASASRLTGGHVRDDQSDLFVRHGFAQRQEDRFQAVDADFASGGLYAPIDIGGQPGIEGRRAFGVNEIAQVIGDRAARLVSLMHHIVDRGA